MVKDLAPRGVDPTYKVLDFVHNLFFRSKLTPREAQQFLLQHYSDAGSERLRVEVKGDCPGWDFLRFKHFSNQLLKGGQLSDGIFICLNFIDGKHEIREVFERERHLFRSRARQGTDEEYACEAVRACRKGLANYGLDEKSAEVMSGRCASYLLKYRRQNKDQLPADSLHRYARLLADEFIHCA